jgi:hypothetical protein
MQWRELSVRRPASGIFLAATVLFKKSNQVKHVDHSCLFLRRILLNTYNRIHHVAGKPLQISGHL